MHTGTLKVPKREYFSLGFFTLSEPIWEGDSSKYSAT
jgi:hypothetical protein